MLIGNLPIFNGAQEKERYAAMAAIKKVTSQLFSSNSNRIAIPEDGSVAGRGEARAYTVQRYLSAPIWSLNEQPGSSLEMNVQVME